MLPRWYVSLLGGMSQDEKSPNAPGLRQLCPAIAVPYSQARVISLEGAASGAAANSAPSELPVSQTT